MPNTTRVQDNERIERADYEFATDESLSAFGRAPLRQFMTNPAGSSLWIISGFGATNPSLKQLQIPLGVAILNMREKGQVLSGVLAFEGQSTKIIDLAAYANGVYDIWIRFELQDGEYQNRIFWNPITAEEFTQSIATRRVAEWGVRVELPANPPGPEWFKIGEVTVSASPTLAVVTKRQFFFEGDEFASYTNTLSDGLVPRVWGSIANDRNADRASFGVKDLQTFTAAVREQLRAMQGNNPATPWYGSVVEGLNRKVSRFGDLTLTGNYRITGDLEVEAGTLTTEAIFPDADGTRSIGGVGARYNEVFARRWDVAGAGPVLDVENTNAALSSKIHLFNTGFEATRYADFTYVPTTGVAGIDVGTGGSLGGILAFSRAGVLKLLIEDAAVTLGGGVNLVSASEQDLGTTSARWGTLFTNNIDAQGSIHAGAEVRAGTYVRSQQQSGTATADTWAKRALWARQSFNVNAVGQRASSVLEMLYEIDGFGNESWDGWAMSVRRVFARDIGGPTARNDGGRVYWSRFGRQNLSATVTDYMSLGPQIDPNIAAFPNDVSYSLGLEPAVMVGLSHVTKRSPPPGFRAGLGALNCVAACAGINAYDSGAPAFLLNTRYNLTNLQLIGVDVLQVDFSIPFAGVNDYHVLAMVNGDYNDCLTVTKLTGTTFAIRATPAGGTSIRDFTPTTNYWISIVVFGMPPVA